MISIDQQLKTVAPKLRLGIVVADGIVVQKRDDVLWSDLKRQGRTLAKQYPTREALRQAPEISALDRAYRSLGVDPRRYPGSAEALGLRMLSDDQGKVKGLYKINTAVDANNLVSLQTLCSVGVYDLKNLHEPLVFRVGQVGEGYTGIGKEKVSIANLPVFADANGPYGSPTADSNRAMITLETKRMMLVIISFAGDALLDLKVSDTSDMLQEYLNVSHNHVSTQIVE